MSDLVSSGAHANPLTQDGGAFAALPLLITQPLDIHTVELYHADHALADVVAGEEADEGLGGVFDAVDDVFGDF